MSEIKGLLYTTDLNTLLLFNKSIKCRLLDRLMPLLTQLGSALFTISSCLLIIFIGKGETRGIGFKALVSLAVSHLIVHLLKNRICRLRPIDVLPNLNTFNVAIDYYSFPSGHTTAVFAIATTLAFNAPLLAFVGFPVAFIVGITRLYLGVHYPSDVLAGMALATFTTAAIQFISNLL
ncbi:phosphatase PAP2 family protein [Ruminiclostridium cellobioparum]|uniref:phosphatase PAP2 family protein n=1 Tax=Ruminiclostridium cellobioparum TaxID=29355 RepID=UPI000487DE75|nr:phosphatase PAP2 family protein [Ruminiclostridium cellobioparum]